MSTLSILKQLQLTISKKYGSNESIGSLGIGFNSHYPTSDDPDDDYNDVPNVVDTDYITHRTFQEQEGQEKNSTDKALPDEPPEVDMDTTPEIETKPSDTSIPANMPGDMGDNITGVMGEQEEEKSSSEIGRIYELKKIYSRLTSIEMYLGNESSNELSEIRLKVSQSIELFEIISSNFNSYTEQLDEIIIMYYKFITEVYTLVKDYYKKEAKSGDK